MPKLKNKIKMQENVQHYCDNQFVLFYLDSYFDFKKTMLNLKLFVTHVMMYLKKVSSIKEYHKNYFLYTYNNVFNLD